MNAYELADELEEFSGNGAFKYYLEIANTLRQQAQEISTLSDRIAELEKQLKPKKIKYSPEEEQVLKDLIKQLNSHLFFKESE